MNIMAFPMLVCFGMEGIVRRAVDREEEAP